MTNKIWKILTAVKSRPFHWSVPSLISNIPECQSVFIPNLDSINQNYCTSYGKNINYSKNQNFIKSEYLDGFPRRSILNFLDDLSTSKKICSPIAVDFWQLESTDIFHKIQNIIRSQSANQIRRILYWRNGHFGLIFIPKFNSID